MFRQRCTYHGIFTNYTILPEDAAGEEKADPCSIAAKKAMPNMGSHSAHSHAVLNPEIMHIV